MALPPSAVVAPRRDADPGGVLFALPLIVLNPLLHHVATKIASQYPAIFDRLGPHQTTLFMIDPVDFPFALLLRPKPGAVMLRACRRREAPETGARIAGRFLDLLRLIDGAQDGDAMFFSRDLKISGNVEAVVSLRNALDDVDGSVAESVAALFGPPGRIALAVARRAGGWQEERQR